MDDSKYYVRSKCGVLAESMTKEQILTAIEQAVESHEIADVDTGFVTKIKEANKGIGLKFWIGSQADYNALENVDDNTFYIISDDTNLEDLQAEIENLQTQINDNYAFLNERTTKLLWEGDWDTWNGGFISLPDTSILFTEYEALYVVVGGSCKKITGAATTTAAQFTENGVYLTRRLSQSTTVMFTGCSGECYGWDNDNADLRSGTLSNIYVSLNAASNGQDLTCNNAIAQNMPLNHVSGSAAEIYAGLHIYKIYGVLKSEAAG